MNGRTQDRLFALAGIVSVAIELVDALIAMGHGQIHSLSWTSSSASIAQAFGKPATTVVWVGAYLELLSTGLFLAFAVWICARLGGGILGAVGRGAAVANVAVTMVSLGLMDAEAYLAGHGLGLSAARALVTVNGATYVTTWFLTAFFLLAVGPLALAAGRRIVGWSAVGLAASILVATAASPSNLGELAFTASLLWIAGTAVALLRREPGRAAVPVTA